MSILTSIFNKIFPSSHAAGASKPSVNQTAATASNTPAITRVPASNVIHIVDVEIILDDLCKKSGQTLNWRKSIVDLLKLLHLDSSLESRKELAQELNYSGDSSDSATMNIWLHKQVMNKLAANGGKVPVDLKD